MKCDRGDFYLPEEAQHVVVENFTNVVSISF